MARTPPQAASPRHPQHAARRRVATAVRPRLDAGCARLSVACWQRACAAAYLRAVVRRYHGRRGARRGTAQRQPELGRARDRRARLHRRRPAQPKLEPRDDHLARRRHLAARREQRAGAPRAAFGTGLAGRAAPRRHSRHQPRPALVCSSRTPYANAGLEGTEFDIRVDENNRLTEIIVLEGEVAVSTPAGELSVGERPCRASRKTAKRRRHHRTRRRSSACAGQATTRRSSITHSPVQTKNRPQPSGPTPTFYATRAARAPSDGAHRGRRSRHRRPPCVSLRGNATALSLSALLALARGDREAARELLARSACRRAELGRRAAGVVARRAELRSARGGRPHVARGARARARQQPSSSTRLAEIALARGDARTAIANATRARSLAPTQSAPLVVLGFANLAGIRYGRGRRRVRSRRRARARRAVAAARIGTCLDSSRRPRRRAAPARARRRPRSGQSVDAQLHGQGLRRRESRRSDDQPARSRQGFRSRSIRLLGCTPRCRNCAANRPVEALQDLQLAARRNGDRPIFGSWLPLDEDIATRSAGLGRVHNELGFGRLALIDAWQAIGDDPTNFAGSPVARGRLCDRAAARDRARQRAARFAVAAACQRHADQAAACAAESFHRAARGAEPHVVRRARVAGDRERPQAPSFGGRRAATASRATTSPWPGCTTACRTASGHYRFATDGFRDNNDLERTHRERVRFNFGRVTTRTCRPSCARVAWSTAI